MKSFIISPSILSANFASLGQDINSVISAGADSIHFDVMDNHYVPNLTIGPIVLKSLKNFGIKVPIDIHLMTYKTDTLIHKFAKLKANSIILHPESSKHIHRSLQIIKSYGCKAGIALNPTTSIEYLKYLKDDIDIILIMSVNPGFSNQPFINSSIKKIKKVYKFIKRKNLRLRLAVDGGIKLNNIKNIAQSGANMFIIGSEIFNNKDYRLIIDKIKLKLSNLLNLNNINV